jgi:ABC-type molybdate transport system substrate-binding protein
VRRLLLGLALLAMSTSGAGAAEPLRLMAAGSLRVALGEVAEAFTRTYGVPVAAEFAASGTLRGRIEQGEVPDLFASADMGHPRALAAAGRGGPVLLFARNELCALARPEVGVGEGGLLAAMLDPALRLGTSTPGADPSGDYADLLFARAEAIEPGAEARLKAKALRLTGAPDSARDPEGRNLYAWVLEEGRADLFLTYCTNARLARGENAALQTLAIPAPLAVGAEYGLIVLAPERPEAWRLAAFILAAEGQAILARHGFTAPLLPREAEG